MLAQGNSPQFSLGPETETVLLVTDLSAHYILPEVSWVTQAILLLSFLLCVCPFCLKYGNNLAVTKLTYNNLTPEVVSTIDHLAYFPSPHSQVFPGFFLLSRNCKS